jgi:hypothetical protein
LVTQRQYETDDFEGQDGKYDLTGTLSDDDGNPITDADLSVKSEDDGSEYSVKTDSDGKFVLENVPAGKYTVTLDSDDYQEISEEHTIGNDDANGEDGSDDTTQAGDKESDKEETGETDTDDAAEGQGDYDSNDSETPETTNASDNEATESPG